ncbi:MAG: DUF47 family protein [Acholeplasmataceae bacterium]|nr:DUF47 family protein [Acholeplasmataceae bacterium]
MSFRLKPKEEKFFEFMDNHAELCVEAADVMVDSVNGKTSQITALSLIEELGNKADKIVEATESKLHKTFIAPLDREDIHVLTEIQNEIMNSIGDFLHKFYKYEPGEPSEGIILMVKNVRDCVKQVNKAINEVPNMKKNYLKIEARTNKIKQLEALGDELYRDEMVKLFCNTTDAIQILKWKEIMTELEKMLDTCVVLADSLKRVVLKYA